jgi:hypothetical protein
MASDKDRLTRSPRAIREGNRDPKNVDGSSVQTSQDEPSKNGSWEGQPDPFRHQKDVYKNKYA